MARLHSRTLIEHVFLRASAARSLFRVIIATDDQRIFDESRRFGAEAFMTREDHASGTDRVAEVAAACECEVVVNIQGDEPLLDPAAIDAAVSALGSAPMATLKKKIDDPREISDPNVVKVVTGRTGDALYFSRSPIPLNRDGSDCSWFKHIGLYVYQRDFLLGYSAMPVGPLERAEKLEQLRALENGHAIRVAETEYESVGVDTPEDLERAAKRMAT